jgi:hypothetical protein
MKQQHKLSAIMSAVALLGTASTATAKVPPAPWVLATTTDRSAVNIQTAIKVYAEVLAPELQHEN